ncbi:MAG: hypothetical protein U0984_12260 [Prosthecobacter sp.]|nr:hypothetical protein [Prosthecobacter sp.]
MQVSWIDPQDVASLAESLRTPPPPPPETAGQSLLEPEDVAVLRGTFDAWGDAPEESAEEATAESPPLTEEPIQEAPVSIEETVPNPILQQGPDLDAFRQRLQAIRSRAVDAGLLPAPVAAIEEARPALPEPLPVPVEARVCAFQAPRGGLVERLEAFVIWARRCIGTGEVFVVDDRGDLLSGPQDQATLILSTLLALNAAARASAWSACEGSQVLHQSLAAEAMVTVIPCSTRLGVMQVAVVAPHAIADGDAAVIRDALIATMDEPG